MHVGIIGLGHMGLAIAQRLLSAGHQLTIYNRTAKKAEPLLAKGAQLVTNPVDTTHGDIVISLLSDDTAVSNIIFGKEKTEAINLFTHQNTNCIHISMSTISHTLCRTIANAAMSANKFFISAPVMGRPQVAAQGELIVMAAGNQ